jgi:hypothetical protein
VDHQHGLCDLSAQIQEVARRQVAGEDGRSRRDEREDGGGDDLVRSVQVDGLADGAHARAFGHHGLELVRLGGGLEQDFAADGEAESADAVRVDIGPRLEVCQGRLHVARTSPAERVRVALALSLAAPVEEQDPVAVLGEEPRRLLRALASRERDHGRTVARGQVPALELQPVARREGDLFVGGA